jgi:dTDP-4-dehydrorhamnose 3,5-epimerase
MSVVLTPQEVNQLWIPIGFGHAFCSLEPNSIISYRVTDYYSPADDKGLAWDDPAIGIDWPDFADPDTLSGKDRKQPLLADLPPYFAVKGHGCA